jgi:predicted O-methyltransferase YrrM
MFTKINNEQNNSDSLQKLINVNKNIKERQFHNHTYILYDIRTILGKTKNTYLEIGSYVGSSASLLLAHEYDTDVICVDPCCLNPIHYNGSDTQYNTLMKNLNNVTTTNKFDILKKYSGDIEIQNYLIKNNIKIDMLFIDGDHSYQGVINDWNNYNKHVNKGGFIIFDDYNDTVFSPEVKKAVNDIVHSLDSTKFEIIGDLPNIHNLDKDNNNYIHKGVINEFIIYKKNYKYNLSHI